MYLGKKARTKKMKMLYKLEGIEDGVKELAYWRKVYNLNDFILGNFYNGDGDGNCEDIPLGEDELNQIINYLAEGGGVDDGYYDEEDSEGDIEKLNKIKEEMDWDNEKLIYHAWW